MVNLDSAVFGSQTRRSRVIGSEATVVSSHAAEEAGFTDTFAALHTLLLTVEDTDDFLQELAELACDIVTPPVSCGITVAYDGSPLTVSSSDATARSFDERQYAVGEGPCLHAWRAAEVVHVSDAITDDRWPEYMTAAAANGLTSSLSLPLIVEGRSMGAANLYCRDRVDPFDARARARAEMFAAQAATVLLLALRRAKRTQTNLQLEDALTSRSVIDQALGILMGQQRCSADEAFALLRTHSQNNNLKLRTVAEDLVRRTASTIPSGNDLTPK